MKKSNIMSFIGLTFFTVYEILIYIINPPFDVDFMIFLLCMGSFFTLPIFLFVCCCCIIYSSIFAIIDKKRADIICGIWALVLLLIWILCEHSRGILRGSQKWIMGICFWNRTYMRRESLTSLDKKRWRRIQSYRKPYRCRRRTNQRHD